LRLDLEQLATAKEELRVRIEEIAVMREVLDRERHRYRELFALAPDGYLVTDTAGVVQEANLAAGQMLGIDPERLAGKPLAAFIATEDRRAFRLGLLAAVAQRTPHEWDLRLLPRFERPIFASATVSVLRDGKGNPTGLLWLLRDVTARRKAEDGLRLLTTELEQRVAERTLQLRAAGDLREDYVHILAHDLRQPLTIILGLAQLLETRLERQGAISDAENAGRIVASGQRMRAMIQDLVDISRLESGGASLARMPVDIGDLVRGLVAGMCEQAQWGRVRIEIPEELAPVAGDSLYLERAVVNLVTNSLKYSAADQPVKVRVTGDAQEVRVTVMDRGTGIPMAEQPLLFQRFHRAKSAGKTDGLGLGLYITRLIVEAHGGRVWVESETSVGSTFYFTLPIAT
ncbi:MAG: PAS domain-containing sensor histidine kinase, partial [Chloroflexota bacterium]